MMLHDALLLWKQNGLKVKAYRRQSLRLREVSECIIVKTVVNPICPMMPCCV